MIRFFRTENNVHPKDIDNDNIINVDIVSGNILLTVDAENHVTDTHPVKLMFTPKDPDPKSSTLDWVVYCNDFDPSGGNHLYDECSGNLTDEDYNAEESIDLGENDSAIVNVELISNITASYDNSFGYYYIEPNKKPSTGHILFDSAKEQMNEDTTFQVTTDKNENVGFFLIPNGGTLNDNYSNGDELSFMDSNNNGYLDALYNGKLVNTDDGYIHFSNSDLNPDGVDSEFNNSNPGNSNWEDAFGGDNDNDDLNLQIELL